MRSKAADQLLSHLLPPDLSPKTLRVKGETRLELENISGTGGESREQRSNERESGVGDTQNQEKSS